MILRNKSLDNLYDEFGIYINGGGPVTVDYDFLFSQAEQTLIVTDDNIYPSLGLIRLGCGNAWQIKSFINNNSNYINSFFNATSK